MFRSIAKCKITHLSPMKKDFRASNDAFNLKYEGVYFQSCAALRKLTDGFDVMSLTRLFMSGKHACSVIKYQHFLLNICSTLF